LNVGVTLFSIAMSAPAQKNFSPAPESRITWQRSSNRASRTASSRSRIISWLYAFAGGLVSSIAATPASSHA
jgi:hypothetical protein